MDKLLVVLSSIIATICFLVFMNNTGKKENNNKKKNWTSKNNGEENIFQKSMRTTSETLSQLVNYINKPSDNILLNKEDIKFSIDIPSISTILIDKYGEKLAEMILKTYSKEEIENLLYD